MMYVLRVLAVSAKSGFRDHRPRVDGFMMKVALVQVGDDLGVAPGVVKVGWVAARWGAAEGAIK